ncbi:MAG: group 1 truncated hemoglobin [Marinobacter sp.]|uniref:group 1 truncated hemoglobin n=1 Tax=Marinobacter sp. TaxID=50741 RepID=UPI0034A0A492
MKYERFRKTIGVTLLLLIGGLTACQHPPTSEPDASLYSALGERTGIESIVEDLLYLIVEDERIAFQFKGIDVAHFHKQLSDQICDLSGGPCEYTGREMRESHSAMAVTETQFNALTENLILAMEQNGITTGAQNRLLALLAPLHKAVRGL